VSPWVKRALLAGGFGTGTPQKAITEIAPVVPISTFQYRSPKDTEAALKQRVQRYITDASYKDGRFKLSEEYDLEDTHTLTKDEHWGVLISQDTPFFHFDIPDLSLPEYEPSKGGEGQIYDRKD